MSTEGSPSPGHNPERHDTTGELHGVLAENYIGTVTGPLETWPLLLLFAR